MPDKKLTDKQIKGLLEYKRKINCLHCDFRGNCCNNTCTYFVIKQGIDLINRQEEKIKKFENRQKPTGASGYKIENGKVVFFTNMLGGCKIVNENLEEVVKTLNELLQEAYSKDEIAFALKCKTEDLEKAAAEIESLKTQNAVIMKQSLAENKTTATAIMAETKQHIMTAEKIKRLEEEIDRLQIAQFQFISEINAYKGKLKTAKSEAVKEFAERLKEKADRGFWQEHSYVDVEDIDNLLNELMGENNVSAL